MKYLLTKEEYEALTTRVKLVEDTFNQKLQALCTLAAQYIPVERPWDEGSEPKPWPCILDKERSMGYCDDCPSRKVCPYDRKRWSK